MIALSIVFFDIPTLGKTFNYGNQEEFSGKDPASFLTAYSDHLSVINITFSCGFDMLESAEDRQQRKKRLTVVSKNCIISLFREKIITDVKRKYFH